MTTVNHAFVDESARGADYYVCAVVVVEAEVARVRKLAQSFRKNGQTTVHFVKERDSRREQIIDTYVRSGLVRARIYYGKGDETVVRDQAMRQLAADLLMIRTDRLLIESRASRDHRDRQALSESLQVAERPFRYEHQEARQDPGLWVADAFAWCYSSGGRWRGKLTSVTDVECEVFKA